MHTEEINKARGFIYNILSLLFVEEYTKEQSDVTKEKLALLKQNAFDEDVAENVEKILTYLEDKPKEELYQNYQELFMVPFGTYVSLSSSLYHEQREAGLMLVKVRDTIAKTKIRKD
ncbi:MAG: molecular chaperone TorD family protein, partial [Arcobacteraceae bacterium]